MSVLVSLEAADLGYGDQVVLADVNLHISRGERIALVGESGAGKSTLLNHIYRLARPQIALCPQSAGLVSCLSVFHNVFMGRLDQHNWAYNLLNLLWPQTKEREQVLEVLRLLGLENKLLISVDQLSGGQQQRTAIARALFQQKPIFMGDEPVSSVDELQAHRILNLLGERHDTLIAAIHDRELAIRCFDRVLGLKNGRIELDQPTAGLTPSDLNSLYHA